MIAMIAMIDLFRYEFVTKSTDSNAYPNMDLLIQYLENATQSAAHLCANLQRKASIRVQDQQSAHADRILAKMAQQGSALPKDYGLTTSRGTLYV